jgi:hypothetical protein
MMDMRKRGCSRSPFITQSALGRSSFDQLEIQLKDIELIFSINSMSASGFFFSPLTV